MICKSFSVGASLHAVNLYLMFCVTAAFKSVLISPLTLAAFCLGVYKAEGNEHGKEQDESLLVPSCG